MSFDLLIAFVAFAFVTSVTPGPNNTMLLASGVNFGIRRTLPHMLGISFGLMSLVLGVGLGLGKLFEQVPMLYVILRYAGAMYLLYLAWKIATSGVPEDRSSEHHKPFSFVQAAAFQWVNPKAWVMAIGAITTYTPQDNFVLNVLLIAGLFALVNCPTMSVWTAAGSLLRNWLRDPRVLRCFNVSMALLLIVSLYPFFKDV